MNRFLFRDFDYQEDDYFQEVLRSILLTDANEFERSLQILKDKEKRKASPVGPSSLLHCLFYLIHYFPSVSSVLLLLLLHHPCVSLPVVPTTSHRLFLDRRVSHRH